MGHLFYISIYDPFLKKKDSSPFLLKRKGIGCPVANNNNGRIVMFARVDKLKAKVDAHRPLRTGGIKHLRDNTVIRQPPLRRSTIGCTMMKR
mgnify:CR=1 FL=1